MAVSSAKMRRCSGTSGLSGKKSEKKKCLGCHVKFGCFVKDAGPPGPIENNRKNDPPPPRQGKGRVRTQLTVPDGAEKPDTDG